MDEATERARRLGQLLEGISDPAMRVPYVGAVFREMTAVEIADILTVAIHGAEARDGAAGALLLAACLALASEDARDLRESVAHAAVARGQHQTALLLSPRPPLRQVETLDVPDFGKGRPLTLGERKSLARRRDRDLLARVLLDPDPAVIKILLDNPALTEEDVMRLCSRRPIAADVLREVFRHTRWIVRYRIRLSIVRNPFTPVDVALQLAAHLNATDAREVVGAAELAPVVREAAQRVAGIQTLH